MTKLEITLLIINWIFIGFFCAKKQREINNSNEQLIKDGFWIFILISAPFWLFVAFIRQTIFEKWK